MLYTFQIFRINLNWMTLADIALLHNRFNLSITTLVNVYVALPVFTSVAGRSYAHFMEQNGGAHVVNR